MWEGYVVYSKAAAPPWKQKMSQMYFFFLYQVLLVFPLISVDPGYPSYSLFSIFFPPLARWFLFVNAGGKLIPFHPLIIPGTAVS